MVSNVQYGNFKQLKLGRPKSLQNMAFLLVGLLLILVVIGAAAFVGRELLTGTPGSTAAPKTVWQNITAGITDGTVPKQTALEAFAYLYRVDIPGVTVPKGIEGDDGPTSGSGAMRWVQANWAELTPDQQAVINRYLVPGPNDITQNFIPYIGAIACGGVC